MAEDLPIAAPSAPAEAAPVPAPTPAPAAGAPAAEDAAPVASETPAPTPSPEKPAVEAAPAKVPEPEAPKPEPSLVAEAGKEPEKPAEAKPAEAPVTETPVLPTFDNYVVPEGVKLGDKEIGSLNSILGQFELDTKADHRLTADLGQKLVDLYIEDRRRDAQLQAQRLTDARKDLVKQVKDDPVFGRNRFETAMRDVARVRDKFASPRFLALVSDTWIGDHPAVIEFMHNVAKELDRHGLLREGTPVAAPPARTQTKAGPRGRYNQSTGA